MNLTLKILTDEKLGKGVVNAFIGLLLLGLCLFWVIPTYGPPPEWYKVWGGPIASILGAVFILVLVLGFGFFAVGAWLLISAFFDSLKVYGLEVADIFKYLIFLAMVASVTFLAYQKIIPGEVAIDFFKGLLLFIVGGVAGYAFSKIGE